MIQHQDVFRCELEDAGGAWAAAAGGAVGAFELIERLGQGGMGVVWRARRRATGEHVAVKLPSAPGEVAVDGLRREIDALTVIAHPGVVRLIDDGEIEGRPWYAMELLEGTSLRARLAHAWGAWFDTGPTAGFAPAGPVSMRAAVTSAAPPPRARDHVEALLAPMIELCDALVHVHAAGLVHRDLTPDNVLLRDDGRPVLVDFGLAVRVARGDGHDAFASTDGIAGTAPYMAPEQITGERVDARADLYALGCILHEIACGAPPFAGPHTGGILSRHLFEAPIAPSRCNPEAPAWLDDIVRGLLAKDPRNRTGSAAEVAAALARGLGRVRRRRPRLSPGRCPDRGRSAAASGGSACAPCRGHGRRG